MATQYNTDALKPGDEVELCHTDYAESLGRFKVDFIRADGAYQASKFNEDTNGWWSGHQFSANGKFSWAKIGSKPKSNGCVCKKCNSGNPWAEPNQPDDTYICYDCRR